VEEVRGGGWLMDMRMGAERIEFYRDMGCEKGKSIDWRD
jgi:hypothetical protein